MNFGKLFIKFSLLVALIGVGEDKIAHAQDEKPLHLSVVEKALRSAKTTAAVKNKLLIEGVNKRKITFWLTADNEKKLRSWGATDQLVEAIRQNQQPMYPMIQAAMSGLRNPVEIKNSSGMEFVLIPAGEFQMGIGETEKDARVYDGTAAHWVKITREFYLGRYEVTQGQWKQIMGANPSNFQDCGADCPIENISWNDAQAFIKKLNERSDSYRYRLPSEAEWEYAARATTQTKYFWGDDAERTAWQYYAHNAQLSPAKVGSYLPNAFGLYDMSGNVWEMCEDVWRTDFKGAADDSRPNSRGDANRRVVRGGGWGQSYDELRVSRRSDLFTDDANYARGFRVAAERIDASTEPKTLKDDNLNGKAISSLVIASTIKGEVRVSVKVDETGKVTEAKFVSGNLLLKEKAVALAKEAKFKEMKADGKLVRVEGILVYTFK